MAEEEQKICPNCKREIPAVNFTIHTVHCARNIKVCPVCKEPVPQSELQEHHDKLHKLVPCKKCGESVCGTDLEDHIRDSCGHTVKSCRFCELELARRELPLHESYCGVRTEQCGDCGEWVMIKYRQLHLDSNHGFLRLDDDPIPQPKKELPRLNLIKPLNIAPIASTSNGLPRPKNTNVENDRPRAERQFAQINAGSSSSSSSQENLGAQSYNGVKTKLKRTNDQPQINKDTNLNKDVTKSVMATPKNLDLNTSRGAVKKRPAPAPPRAPPRAEPARDQPYFSALLRQQEEERRRQELSAYNASIGLPPVLSPAAKLEKLRKMDALQNRETEDKDYKNRLLGRVWMPPDVPVGHVLGSPPQIQNDLPEADQPRISANPIRLRGNENEDRSHDFRDVKPMTPQEFMERFNELQLRKTGERKADRFSEIKSSLRELRRGLNEVTAPYNANNMNTNNANGAERALRRTSPSPVDDEEVELPCEFCGAPVPADDLVQHQTGCRPDLTQLRRSPTEAPPPPALDPEDPVIPCEFCTQPLPVYLISEHQERCGREANLLYPD